MAFAAKGGYEKCIQQIIFTVKFNTKYLQLLLRLQTTT